MNIVSQHENQNNIYHNIFRNENMLQFTAKWRKENAYKIQPSFHTLSSSGIKIIEDGHKKTRNNGLMEEKNI